jgi:hypothetical protein
MKTLAEYIGWVVVIVMMLFFVNWSIDILIGR